MELGQRIKTARLEKGLSQRQLCGDMITRNMLSLIENGSARPSMDTLTYLARQLDKPVSFFLQEDTIRSPNYEVMVKARKAYQLGEYLQAKDLLSSYREPDETFDAEKELLQLSIYLLLAQQAIQEERIPYAQRLLEEASEMPVLYCKEQLLQKRQLLMAQAGMDTTLPDVDQVLTQKAQQAIQQKHYDRAAAYLDACEVRSDLWQLLRGQVYFYIRDYEQAVLCLHKAETQFENRVAPLLEQCYSELEDYKMAYFYACKQKK